MNHGGMATENFYTYELEGDDRFRLISGGAHMGLKNGITNEVGAIADKGYRLTWGEMLFWINKNISHGANQMIFHGYHYDGELNTAFPQGAGYRAMAMDSARTLPGMSLMTLKNAVENGVIVVFVGASPGLYGRISGSGAGYSGRKRRAAHGCQRHSGHGVLHLPQRRHPERLSPVQRIPGSRHPGRYPYGPGPGVHL